MPPRKKKPPARDSKADAPGLGQDMREWMERFWKPMAALVIGVLGIVWVAHMEDVALHQRIERELLSDPRTAPWFAEQRRLIAMPEGGSEAGASAVGEIAPPRALWAGTIMRLVVGRPRPDGDASDELVALELDDVELLAGSAGKEDGSTVYIGVRGFPFPGGAPTQGERWMFSVSRNDDGYNHVYSAIRDIGPR